VVWVLAIAVVDFTGWGYQTLAASRLQPKNLIPQFLHLPTTAFLGKKHSPIGWDYPTDALNLPLATSTQRKKQNAVLWWFNHLVQARS
jgi:hypothetical protein